MNWLAALGARPLSALLFAFGLLLLTTVASRAEVRTWTDDLDRTWQGEFVRIDGPSAVFMVGGKEYPFPLTRLIPADRALVYKLRLAPPAAAAPVPENGSTTPVAGAATTTTTGPAQPWTFGNVPIQPGQTIEADLPIAGNYAQEITKDYEATTLASHVRVSLAVPEGFDGNKPQKVLLPVATATGDTLSISVARDVFTKDALAHGWLVLAADGANGKPKTYDTDVYRLTLLEVALDELNARFPGAKAHWTFATAGFSGGAGYAGYQALWLSGEGYRVTGMLLLNGPYSPVELEPELFGNTASWHRIPVFISWGQNDNVATPAIMRGVIQSTVRGGYQNVRIESHPGRHEPWDPHVNLALEWFDSLANGTKP